MNHCLWTNRRHKRQLLLEKGHSDGPLGHGVPRTVRQLRRAPIFASLPGTCSTLLRSPLLSPGMTPCCQRWAGGRGVHRRFVDRPAQHHGRNDHASRPPNRCCISTLGAGGTRADVRMVRPQCAVWFCLARNEVADKEAMERHLGSTDLDWIVVHVSQLTNGPRAESFRVADDRSIRGMGKIARSDVADFMLCSAGER